MKWIMATSWMAFVAPGPTESVMIGIRSPLGGWKLNHTRLASGRTGLQPRRRLVGVGALSEHGP